MAIDGDLAEAIRKEVFGACRRSMQELSPGLVARGEARADLLLYNERWLIVSAVSPDRVTVQAHEYRQEGSGNRRAGQRRQSAIRCAEH